MEIIKLIIFSKALYTLQWEVERLDAENRGLREYNPEASEHVDHEAELMSKVAEMTSRVQACEQQLGENARTMEEAENQASVAEQRVKELEELKEVSSTIQAYN